MGLYPCIQFLNRENWLRLPVNRVRMLYRSGLLMEVILLLEAHDEFYKVSAVGKTEKLTALNPGYRIG